MKIFNIMLVMQLVLDAVRVIKVTFSDLKEFVICCGSEVYTHKTIRIAK